MVRASPTHTVRYSGNLSMELHGSVGAVPPVRCPEIRDVCYSGDFNVLEFGRDMKGRPLFG